MEHSSNRLLLCITICLFIAACEGPTGIMSGEALSGTVTDPPAVWQFEESSALAQLETRPQDPYSINIVYVQIRGKLYIYAGDTRTNWVQHIEQTPLIRLRVDEVIYPLCAVRVQDRAEFLAFAEEWRVDLPFSAIHGSLRKCGCIVWNPMIQHCASRKLKLVGYLPAEDRNNKSASM